MSEKNYPFAGKIIILNAPPNAGKDTVADYLVENRGMLKASFKKRLMEVAATIAGVSVEKIEHLNSRELKEVQHPEFSGKTTRQFLIYVSEKVIKPNFGQNYFGYAALSNINLAQMQKQGYVFSDGGFPMEAQVFGKAIPNKNVVHVLRFSREGCSFDGDSRSYLQAGIENVTVSPILENNSTLEYFAKLIEKQITKGGDVLPFIRK